MKDPEFTRWLRWGALFVGSLAPPIVWALKGVELFVLTLAASVLVLVIFVLWNSIQSLTGESELSLEEALSMARPSAEEEQKRAVLRTLKDLEYERSVGKISEADYQELVGVYRERAKTLIQAVDESTEHSREHARALLEKRLAKLDQKPAGGTPAKRTKNREQKSKDRGQKAKPRIEPAAAAGSAPKVSLANDALDQPERITKTGPSEGSRCPECSTTNDLDARFCKRCGVTLEAAS